MKPDAKHLERFRGVTFPTRFRLDARDYTGDLPALEGKVSRKGESLANHKDEDQSLEQLNEILSPGGRMNNLALRDRFEPLRH